MSADGNEFDYQIIQQTENNDVNLQLEVTSRTNAAMENVSYAMKIPVSVFSQGRVELRNGSTLVGSMTLPAVLPQNYQLLFANANRIIIDNSSANIHIEMTLSRVVPMGVQDNRQFGDSSLLDNICGSTTATCLPARQATIGARTFATTVPDNNTAHVTIDPCTTVYRFDGWGGAFGFQIGICSDAV